MWNGENEHADIRTHFNLEFEYSELHHVYMLLMQSFACRLWHGLFLIGCNNGLS